jgi:DNA primase
MKIPNGMNSPVQKIKERLSIEEVISSYLKLEKSGVNFKAKCPFHNEKTPSFFVSPGRNSFYCFGCGAKGDIFTFVEEFEGLDFKGALKLLANRAGVVLEQFNPEAESEKERLYRAMEVATEFFSENLLTNEKGLAYLKARGLTEHSIKDFRIGFVKNDWRELYNYLSKKGFSDTDLEKAGLVKKTEKGYYDRFRGRIMFPIADSSGRIIAFSGRLFEDDGKSAKYLNSPETPIFNKSSVLYGLDKAKDSIRKNNFSILVEGQFDLVLSHQAGFRNTVATSGTALTDATFSKENVVSNLGLIRRISGNLVLAFDADKAGINASLRASKIALSLGMDVKVASLPEGVDPADLISGKYSAPEKGGTEAWREAIRNAKHVIEFLLDKILSQNQKDSRYLGREIKERVLPYVAALDSAIEQMHFLKKISERAQIPESALENDLKKVAEDSKDGKAEIEKAEASENKIFRKDYIARRLLGIVFWQETLSDKMLDGKILLGELSEILKKKPEELLTEAESAREDLVFEAEVLYGETENLKKEAAELLFNLEEEALKEKLLAKMQELRLAELGQAKEKSDEALREINELNKKIQAIKSGRIKN